MKCLTLTDCGVTGRSQLLIWRPVFWVTLRFESPWVAYGADTPTRDMQTASRRTHTFSRQILARECGWVRLLPAPPTLLPAKTTMSSSRQNPPRQCSGTISNDKSIIVSTCTIYLSTKSTRYKISHAHCRKHQYVYLKSYSKAIATPGARQAKASRYQTSNT